jgi:hypothetical protein
MGKFRIGQRVRVVRDDSGDFTELIGREARITEPFGKYIAGSRYSMGGSFVHGYVLSIGVIVAEHEIEPIQDRPELSTWDAIREIGIDVHGMVEA